MLSFIKKIFDKKEPESNKIVKNPVPEPEPELPEIEFDPVKHLIYPFQLKQSILRSWMINVNEIRILKSKIMQAK